MCNRSYNLHVQVLSVAKALTRNGFCFVLFVIIVLESIKMSESSLTLNLGAMQEYSVPT